MSKVQNLVSVIDSFNSSWEGSGQESLSPKLSPPPIRSTLRSSPRKERGLAVGSQARGRLGVQFGRFALRVRAGMAAGEGSASATLNFATSQPRINRLRLKCEDGEHAFVHAAEGFLSRESLEGFDPKGEFAERERSFAADAAAAQSFDV